MPTKNRKATIKTAKEVLDAIGIENASHPEPLANNLPDEAVEAIAQEIGSKDYVKALLTRLQMKNVAAVPIVNVLKRLEELPGDVDDITDEQVQAIRQAIQDEIKACSLSDQERKDLAKYEAQIDKGLRQSAEALRAIRDGRLYREDYSSWDSYCMARWRFSGTTGDNKIAWLRMTELIEERLGEGFSLGTVEAKALLRLQDKPEMAAEALVAAEERAKSEGRKRQAADVAAEVERRREYSLWDSIPGLMSLDEFESLRSAGVSRYDMEVVIPKIRNKQAEGMTFEDAIEATEMVANRRKAKAKEEKKAALEAARRRVKEIKQSSDLTAAQEEVNRLKQEIAELDGVQDGDGKGGGEVKRLKLANLDGQEVGDQDEEPDSSHDESPPASEVRQSLDSALESLDDALTGDWPVEDADELDRILAVAEDIEKKLAEITAKAKELLADVEEPEAVSSVD